MSRIQYLPWRSLVGVPLLVMSLVGGVRAAEPPRTNGDPTGQPPQIRNFVSSINGVRYRLTILLPKDYQDSDDRYPVFYLTDGNTLSLLASYVVPRMIEMRDVPKIIVVGVGYQGVSERGVDYRPMRPRADSEDSGKPEQGADTFVRVLREEVFPRIDKEFRTDPTDRGIGGHSLGGVFAAYVLFHDPGLFGRFWISSPFLLAGDRVVFNEEAAYAAAHADLKARVFADVGADEMPVMRESLIEMHKAVKAHGWRSLSWKQELPPDQVHSTVPAVAFPDAMHFLYAPPEVHVKAAQLRAYAGRYRFPSGKIFSITTDGRDLYADKIVLDNLPQYETKLLPKSPTVFTVRALGLELAFTDMVKGVPAKALVYRDELDFPPEVALREKMR